MEHIEEYFSLKRFAHRDLWKKEASVWAPLHLLNEYLQSKKFRIEITIPPEAHLVRPELIAIGKGTIIEPGVYIEGPCIIGSHCILRNGSYLHGGVICGDYVAIGHSAEIKHSILFDFSAATHFTYVGDSIVGSRVNLGAGVKCSNLRIDRREVTISFGKKRIKTGLKKFGAIIGDRVQIGCNCVLNPGTLIGQGTIAHPLLNFGGAIPSKSRIIGEKSWKFEPLTETVLETIGKPHVS